MAGTTAKYSLAYPTSTDYLTAGAAKIEELADGVDALLSSNGSTGYLQVATEGSTTTGYTRASGTTTFGAFTGAPTYSITTGKSGRVMIILTADFANGTTANGMACSYSLSAGAFSPTYATAITTQNARTGASFVYVHELDADSSYTLTLQGATLTSTGALTIHNHTVQSIELG
jgi:hypothetical protein